jgi:DNA-binding CsgD family transcriptional regulator
MHEDRPLPWRKMWDFLSCCAEAADLTDLFSQATREVPRLIPCDQASAVLTEMTHQEANLLETQRYPHPRPGDISLRIVLSVPNERLMDTYLRRYFYMDYAMLNVRPDSQIYQYDWRERKFSGNEFVEDFVLPLWLMHTTVGLPFFAEDGRGGLGFALSRSGALPFSDREISMLGILRPHMLNLYNLHRRIQRLSSLSIRAAETAPGHELLSRREDQIARLLCERLRPAEIASLLLLSRRTVERHVEHIYQKLGVRCRRDMVRTLLGD